MADLRLPYPAQARLDSTAAEALHGAACPQRGINVPNRLISWLLLTFTMVPALARAHAILEDSSPPPGAAVKPGPLDLQLRYNSRIDRDRSRLTLIHPDRTRDTIPIAPNGPPDIINAHLTLAPGTYVIRWQVLAIDGHITRGDVPLTVTEP